MKIRSCACTHKGYRKDVNQDALLLKIAVLNNDRIAFAILCDGMGGLESGEIASAQGIREMERWFYEELPEMIEANQKKAELETKITYAVKKSWEKLITQINIQIAGYGRLHDKKIGTTILAILLVGQTYIVMHVGDCRLYYTVNGQREQMTVDQTYVQNFVESRILTQKEAEEHPQAHVLLQCIGASQTVIPKFYEGRLEHKMSFLLCSDGFWKKADMEKVYETMEKSYRMTDGRIEKKVEQMISRCRQKGETDDISAIIITIKKHGFFGRFNSIAIRENGEIC